MNELDDRPNPTTALDEGLDWDLGGAMNPNDIITNPETLGWHRFIAHETSVIPTAVYYEGRHGGDRSDATLVVEIKASSLAPEPLRYPPPGWEPNQDVLEEAQAAGVPIDLDTREGRGRVMFPLRRTNALSEDEYANLLDDIVYVPFRLVVRPD